MTAYFLQDAYCQNLLRSKVVIRHVKEEAPWIPWQLINAEIKKKIAQGKQNSSFYIAQKSFPQVRIWKVV